MTTPRLQWPTERHPVHGYRINPNPLLGVRGELYNLPPAKKLEAEAAAAATLFTDVSEFQRSIYTTAYPYQFGSFRSNDGTYRDQKFPGNIAFAKAACDAGRWTGFLDYFVWRPNWEETVATLKAMVGTPHPKMAVMLDVESWGGDLGGNQSAGINAAREEIIDWLGGNRARVIGYGNGGDLASMWPSRGDAKVILANYSSNPDIAGKLAHQYTSSANVAPFGSPVDMNSADGLTPAAFAAALGLEDDDMPTAQEVAAAVWAYQFKNEAAHSSASAQQRLFVEVGGNAYQANHGVIALSAKVDALTKAISQIAAGTGVDVEAIKAEIDEQIKTSLENVHLEVVTDSPA